MKLESIELQIGKPPVLTVVSESYNPGVTDGEGRSRVGHSLRAKFARDGFRAETITEVFTWELESFHDQLVVLNRELQGEAKFEPLDCNLELQATIDHLGHITWSGSVGEYSDLDNKSELKFQITDDQTSLPLVIAQLKAIMGAR
jgi:hypothetical protein